MGGVRHETDRVRIGPGRHPHVVGPAVTNREPDRQEPDPDEGEITCRNGQSMGEVVERLRMSNASLIALDGLPGAGKSRLAVRLSALLKVRSVHLDDYLVRNSVGFVDHLDDGELRRALLVRPVIVEGVCMLDVLDRIGLRPDPLVYLQAPTSARYLDASHPLLREVHAYTERAHPAGRATFVLMRSESGQKPFGRRKRGGVRFDAYLSRNRSRIARLLAIGGLITLAMGTVAVVVTSSGHDAAVFRLFGVEFSAPAVGLLTALTSGLSIFLVYSARSPTRPRSSSSRR